MLYFENDYSEGACPEVLEHLIKTNNEKLAAYGFDKYSNSAKEKIKAACQCPDADVYLLTGGTQTNRVVIGSMLRQYEGVISAISGHVNQHEAGAIENSGHKVLGIPHKDGKISADTLRDYIEAFYADGSHEHMVFPGMVYISHPTEYGTLYTRDELKQLHEVCAFYKIPLYMDGARLGYGLAADGTDVTMADVAKYCDVFYIGGTKVGALCGEAVVFTKNNTPRQFITITKLYGAMVAKSRINGVQFDRLFTDNLYLEISKKAIATAKKLRGILLEKNYRFFVDSPTNQLFPILENSQIERLSKDVKISIWEPYDENHTVVRFATSWATTNEDVDALAELL